PKTFDWWGGCAKEVRSDVKWKKTFLCATENTPHPSLSLQAFSSAASRRRKRAAGSRGGSPLPARLAPCGV
ncbi:hypothetical protein, partial [Bilophila wadsworthia]|uniref:hypothetical protein n=1 Tax=Bilophila wadsworthia TaxID=35833 RepID=UPI003AF10FF7